MLNGQFPIGIAIQFSSKLLFLTKATSFKKIHLLGPIWLGLGFGGVEKTQNASCFFAWLISFVKYI